MGLKILQNKILSYDYNFACRSVWATTVAINPREETKKQIDLTSVPAF